MTKGIFPRYLILVSTLAVVVIGILMSMYYGQYRWLARNNRCEYRYPWPEGYVAYRRRFPMASAFRRYRGFLTGVDSQHHAPLCADRCLVLSVVPLVVTEWAEEPRGARRAKVFIRPLGGRS